MSKRLAACVPAVLLLLPAAARAAESASAEAEAASSAAHRTVLDRYCVTCHNDRTRTANLSLEGADLTAVGDRAELWEKVVRKLRAGMMPPPGVRRPPAAE